MNEDGYEARIPKVKCNIQLMPVEAKTQLMPVEAMANLRGRALSSGTQLDCLHNTKLILTLCHFRLYR